MTALRDWRMWADDRIHMTTEGHRRVALNAFTTLGLRHRRRGLVDTAAPRAVHLARRRGARQRRSGPATYVGPWVQRRLRGQSSGDSVSAKRPTLLPPVRPED